MREEIADLVYPVVAYGLDLKARLERGERPDFAAEQTELRNRLKTENESRRWPEYGGDGERYFGIRYALTCWLDEIFTDSPWEEQWKERILEDQLYFSRERASRFWEQAALAQGRAEADAVEAFYLCVMLGFRGMGPEGQTLHGWRDAVEEQLTRAQGKAWPGPQEMQPDVFAPPRRARDRLRLVLMGVVGLLAVIIPWVTYLVVKHPLVPK